MNTLFLTLLNMSIAATWAILAVLLLRPLLRKAPKWICCLLWAIPALRLLIPAFWESDLSLMPSAQVIPTDIAQAETPMIYSGISEINSTVNPLLTRQVDSLPSLLEIAATVWVIGLGILLLYSIVSWMRLRLMVRQSMRHEQGFYLCDAVKSPFILGIFRPRIYLPTGLDEETIRHVTAHEKAHLKRLDHLWKPLGYLLLSIYWFNPLLWVAYILLCRDIERACDEQVLRTMDDQGKLRYAKALVDCSTHRKMILTCPVAFGEISVKSRIKAVLTYKKPAFWVVLVAFIAGAVTSLCFLTNPTACRHHYQGEITLAATCTQKGHETFTCTDCGHSYMAMLSPCQHAYIAVVLQPSDCANHGTEELTCVDCGFVTTRSLPLATDLHDLLDRTFKEPACGTAGIGHTTCSRCSYLHAYELPALEHQYEVTEREEPCCSRSGKEVQTCKLCGHQVKKLLPRNGKHSWHGDKYSRICGCCGMTDWGVPPMDFGTSTNNTRYRKPQTKDPTQEPIRWDLSPSPNTGLYVP